jgi:hypothetical protein
VERWHDIRKQLTVINARKNSRKRVKIKCIVAASCRFEHFFKNRDSLEERLEAGEKEKARLDELITTQKMQIDELVKMINARDVRITELEPQQATTILELVTAPSTTKKDRSKTKVAAS